MIFNNMCTEINPMAESYRTKSTIWSSTVCIMKLIQWPTSYPIRVYNMSFNNMHNEINPMTESYPTKSDNMIFNNMCMCNEINPMAESYPTKPTCLQYKDTLGQTICVIWGLIYLGKFWDQMKLSLYNRADVIFDVVQ